MNNTNLECFSHKAIRMLVAIDTIVTYLLYIDVFPLSDSNKVGSFVLVLCLSHNILQSDYVTYIIDPSVKLLQMKKLGHLGCIT